ncbi:hypothetical protein MOKP106_42650 [Mycobacterium avium subsp. hominissuis]|uniref:hypothetical protein n=1 Tax=Mycobacterium avium TaxID=1764 RepID=UPI0012DAEC7F|nr:hypothetical protein [Mycobacterium avium]
MSDNLGGISKLHERRARRARQAPAPRHPKLGAAAALDEDLAAALADTATPDHGSVSQAPPHPSPPAAASAAAPGGPGTTSQATAGSRQDTSPTNQPADMPRLDIDPDDPTAHLVSPTVLSVPGSIVKRFERARAHAPSHTALVLDALRAHAHELPALILNRRPGPKPGDLFPFREAPGRTAQDTPLPVRIRPTKGELAVMKALTDWCSATITKQRPGTRETNRSEMVAAALDAFLPAPAERRAKQ